jgi:hypothetical protein
MRLRLNKYENKFLKEAIKNLVEKRENETKQRLKENEKLIYGRGYFEVIGEEIINRVDRLTLTKHL